MILDTKKEIITVMKNGKETEAEVIALFKLEEFNKDYILYTLGERQNDNVKIIASTFNKTEDGCTFENVESEAEWSAIKEVIKDLAKTK